MAEGLCYLNFGYLGQWVKLAGIFWARPCTFVFRTINENPIKTLHTYVE